MSNKYSKKIKKYTIPVSSTLNTNVSSRKPTGLGQCPQGEFY